jgi:kinetochore protein Nuf2
LIFFLKNSISVWASLLQVQKEIADHDLAEQMEEPMAQQLEADVNALQQKVQAYNKQQLALRAKATAINDKKEEIHRKVCSFSCLVSASCFHSPPKKTNQVL